MKRWSEVEGEVRKNVKKEKHKILEVTIKK